MVGETINYYYLGYLLNGSIARVADLPGWTPLTSPWQRSSR